ncbi:hypothetical protein CLF_105277 [Clonorchis sinensis]|uniref:dDENN domain-containing protein n=1 Tax=Clonorchis sinensis TaxID=79923 RepID=G7YP64_CLOSI|nr:hypothetical protein CLF_105277 [Clonorchis sinensis]
MLEPLIDKLSIDDGRVVLPVYPGGPILSRQWLLRRCFSSHHAILRRKRPTQETAAASLVSPFLEAMAILLGGYREAMIRGTKTGSFTHVLLSSNWTFDPNTFMATRGRECQAYLRELLQSQMFHQFIESRLAELNSDLGMIHQDDFEDCISRVPSQVRSNLSDLLERGRRGFGRLATRLANVKLKRREQNKLSSESSSSESDFSKTPEPVALLKVPPTFRPASSPTRSVSQKTCSPAVSDAQLNIPRAQRSLLSSILDSVSDVSADWLRSDSTPTTTGAPHRPKLGPESQPVKSASKPVAVVEPTTPVSHVKIDIFPDTGCVSTFISRFISFDEFLRSLLSATQDTSGLVHVFCQAKRESSHTYSKRSAVKREIEPVTGLNLWVLASIRCTAARQPEEATRCGQLSGCLNPDFFTLNVIYL